MYFVPRRYICFYGGFSSDFGGLLVLLLCFFFFSLRATLKKSKQMLLEVRRERSGFQTDLARKPNSPTWDANNKVTLGAQSQQKQNFSPILAALL